MTAVGQHRLRVLHVCPRYPPARGGSEYYMMRLSEGLARAGHAVTVLTTDALAPDALHACTPAHDRMGGSSGLVEVVRCPVPESGPRQAALAGPVSERPSFPCEQLLGYSEQVTRHQFDIVHVACFPFANLIHAGIVAARNAGCPWALTPFMHTHPCATRHFRRPILRDLALGAQTIVCQTRHEASFFGDWGIPSSRLLRLGVTIETHPPRRGDGARFRRRYGLRHDHIVAHLATNDRWKGTQTLLTVAERTATDAVCFIIAGHRTAAVDQAWNAISARTKPNVRLLGPLDEADKHDLFDAMSLMVVPSAVESFGIVYLESWLYRRPVIAVDYGATAELIDHDENGLLVPFEDADRLETALRRYLDHDAVRQAHGRAGHDRLMSLPSWKEKTRTLEALYTSLAARRPRDDRLPAGRARP